MGWTEGLIEGKQTFRNPKPELVQQLESMGVSVENGVKKGGASADKQKKARKDKNVDMEKLADGLQKLSEDDLLHVVTMVHDNKTSETYTKNDVESESAQCTFNTYKKLCSY